LRIGLITDMKAGLPVDPQVSATLVSAARALEAAGAIVEPLDSFLNPQMLDGVCRFFEARSNLDVAAMNTEQRASVLPFILEWSTWRADGFTGRDVMAAYMQIMAMREAAVCAVSDFDFVLSPTAPVLAYPAEHHSPNNDPRNALAHIAFTVAYNMSEHPAASINWQASVEGLPIGVQIIGQRFNDLAVLRFARLLETLRPAQRAWPDPVSTASAQTAPPVR